MFGILLVALGTILDETSSSIGKWEVLHRREDIYTYGFLNVFWVLLSFLTLIAINGNFVFSLQSLPFFLLLVVFETAQVYSSLHANVIADRSTFGFIMIGTIPLLLVVDFVLGYDLNITGIAGMSAIVIGLLVLLVNHGITKRGIGYVIFSTINAVITISLFKYLITNFNSVEGQQIVMSCVLLVFLFCMAIVKSKKNPFRFLFRKDLFAQSVAKGIGGMLISFAYLYAPASIITSGKRGMSVIWSIIAGHKYFHEKHIVVKIISFLLVGIGIVLLTV